MLAYLQLWSNAKKDVVHKCDYTLKCKGQYWVGSTMLDGWTSTIDKMIYVHTRMHGT